MRKSCWIVLSFVVAFVSLRSGVAQSGGPCYSDPQQSKCPGQSCNKFFNEVSDVNDGWTYNWLYVDCCGVQVQAPDTRLVTCSVTELRNPEIQKDLLIQAQHADVFVASCDGFLRPLPHIVVARKVERPLLLTDDGRIHPPGL